MANMPWAVSHGQTAGRADRSSIDRPQSRIVETPMRIKKVEAGGR